MGYASTILFSAWMIAGFNGGWLISLHPTLPLWIAVSAIGVAWVGSYQKKFNTTR